MKRRDFLTTTALGSIALGLDAQTTTTKQDGHGRESMQEAAPTGKAPAQPVMVSSANGFNGMDKGYQMLLDGGDTLDAAIAVGQTQEDDANDMSVGLGGLPDEDGRTTLDSCCMHGPTRRAGSVGCISWTKNAARLGHAVMTHTGHVMLVGTYADTFAKDMGFPNDLVLTERARQVWMLWKEYHSGADWWGPSLSDPEYTPPAKSANEINIYDVQLRRLRDAAADLGIPEQFRTQAILAVLVPPHGTIHVSALKPNGEMSGMTTTSGLAWKIAGRVGDSAVIGAGSYTDQDVGSAGATGSGEENIRIMGAHTIVENMRHGMSPRDAGIDALKRIVRNYKNDMNKLQYVSMTFYVLRKDGEYAGVSLWSGAPEHPTQFCVHDGKGKRLEDCTSLVKGVGSEFPPTPKALEDAMRRLRGQRQQRGQQSPR
ncbi:MAG: isoaspartyl peptidase/L-asparaginase [Terriglobales bacterium]